MARPPYDDGVPPLFPVPPEPLLEEPPPLASVLPDALPLETVRVTDPPFLVELGETLMTVPAAWLPLDLYSTVTVTPLFWRALVAEPSLAPTYWDASMVVGPVDTLMVTVDPLSAVPDEGDWLMT